MDLQQFQIRNTTMLLLLILFITSSVKSSRNYKKEVDNGGQQRSKRHILAALKSQDLFVLNNKAVVADKPLWPGWGFGTLVGNPVSPNVQETPALAANAYKTLGNYKGSNPADKKPIYPNFLTAAAFKGSSGSKDGVYPSVTYSNLGTNSLSYYSNPNSHEIQVGDQVQLNNKPLVKAFTSNNRDASPPEDFDLGSKWQVTKDRLDEEGIPVQQAGLVGIDTKPYESFQSPLPGVNFGQQTECYHQLALLKQKILALKMKGVIDQTTFDSLIATNPTGVPGMYKGGPHSNRVANLPDEPDWGSKWQVQQLRKQDAVYPNGTQILTHAFSPNSNRNPGLPDEPDWGSKWQSEQYSKEGISSKPKHDDGNPLNAAELLKDATTGSTRVGDVKVTYNGSMTIVEQTVIIPGEPPAFVNHTQPSTETTPSPVTYETTPVTPYWWNTPTTPTTPTTPSTPTTPTTPMTPTTQAVALTSTTGAVSGVAAAKAKPEKGKTEQGKSVSAEELGLSKRYLAPLNRYARHRNPIFDMQAGDTMAFSNYQILGNQDVVFKSWVPEPKRKKRDLGRGLLKQIATGSQKTSPK